MAKSSTSQVLRSSQERGIHRSEITETLLQDILQGKLAAGERLVTESLARRFGVSHTPIREAISTLAGMGVIHVVANCGATVRKFTTRDVREICQFRRVLECEAVRSAIGNIDPKALEKLKARFTKSSKIKSKPTRKDVMDAIRWDNELHQLIRESSKNRFLRDELRRLMALVTVIRDVAWERLLVEDTLERVVVESHQHLDIVNALLAGNRTEAVRSMSLHLRSGTKSIVRAVE